MLKRTFLGIALITLASGCAVPGPELVANGGFEGGNGSAVGWQVGTGHDTQTAEVVDDGSGNRILAFTGQLIEEIPWPQAISSSPFTVVPGAEYFLSFRARSDGYGLVIPIVWFLDAGGEALIGSGPGALEVDSADWADYGFEVAAPEGAATAYVILRLALNSALTNESFLAAEVDDVSVRQVGR